MSKYKCSIIDNYDDAQLLVIDEVKTPLVKN